MELHAAIIIAILFFGAGYFFHITVSALPVLWRQMRARRAIEQWRRGYQPPHTL